jgi:hypothetical protein
MSEKVPCRECVHAVVCGMKEYDFLRGEGCGLGCRCYLPDNDMNNCPECKGLFGRLFGHNYQPAEDTERIPPQSSVSRVNLNNYVVVQHYRQIIESSTKVIRTYRGHVCTRCGDVVNRKENDK